MQCTMFVDLMPDKCQVGWRRLFGVYVLSHRENLKLFAEIIFLGLIKGLGCFLDGTRKHEPNPLANHHGSIAPHIQSLLLFLFLVRNLAGLPDTELYARSAQYEDPCLWKILYATMGVKSLNPKPKP